MKSTYCIGCVVGFRAGQISGRDENEKGMSLGGAGVGENVRALPI